MPAASIDPKVVESIPESVLAILPAATPPLGVQPNFIHPETRVPVLLTVGSIFLVFALFCYSIRIYTKVAILKSWRWDDATITLGFMFGIVYYVFVVMGCLHGATGRHMWDVHLNLALSKSSLYQDYVTTIVATPALGLIKCSLLIQYYTIFKPLRWVRICVWIGAIISVTFYVAVSITALVLESPWLGEGLMGDILSWHYLEFSKFSVPTGVIGMTLDLYLLILPIPAVLTLKMSPAMKLGILVVFTTGGMAAIASIISLYYRILLQNDVSDATWRVSYVLLWSEVEFFAGVAASSMPNVHRFVAPYKPKIASWSASWRSGISDFVSSSRANKGSKLADNPTAGASQWSLRETTRGSENREEYDMKSIGGGSLAAQEAETPLVGSDAQIYLTRNVTVAYEHVNSV